MVKRGVLILLAALVLGVGGWMMFGVLPPLRAAYNDPYHPAYHGLPARLAEYKVVMVITQKQNRCLGDLVLFSIQSAEPTLPDYLLPQDTRDLETIRSEHPNWRITIVGAQFDREAEVELFESGSEMLSQLADVGVGCL